LNPELPLPPQKNPIIMGGGNANFLSLSLKRGKEGGREEDFMSLISFPTQS